jgi:hypothetical protein
MIGKSERGANQSVANKVKNQCGVPQVKGRLGENCLASEQRIYNLAREAKGSFVVEIVTIAERNREARVGYSIHFFEKPLREDRAALPDTFPAKRRNGRSSRARAFSNPSRMSLP